MDYETLPGPDGQEENMGGLTQRFYFARVKDFLSLKEPTPTPTTLADVVEITATHTFNTGKCFIEGYCTQNKGKYDAEPQGEMDGKSLKQSMEVFVPGSTAKAHGFAAKGKNDSFIALAEMPDGTMMQLGNKMFFAKMTPKFGTETNAGGVRGYMYTFESMGPSNLVYTGAVSLTPAP